MALCIFKSTFFLTEVFYKKVVLENFPKFTEKHLCQGLFLNKVAGLSESFKNISFTVHFQAAASICSKDSIS